MTTATTDPATAADHHPASRWRCWVGMPVLAVLVALAASFGPALVTPSAAPQAAAATATDSTGSTSYQEDIPDAAYSAASYWEAQGWPRGREWHQTADGNYFFSGGEFHNYEGNLPDGQGPYYEYDIYAHASPDADRGVERIVRSVSTGTIWYTPNHYHDFYRL